MYVDALLIALAAACDRIRGGWKIVPTTGHKIAGLLYGAVLGYLLGLPPLWCAATSVLWWLGEKPGWGYPMGRAILGAAQHDLEHPNAKPERWQVGFLKGQPWLSLVVRGAMWALPVLPIGYWHPQAYALIGMAVVLPAGALVDHFMRRGQWATGEWVRGALIGVICAAAS